MNVKVIKKPLCLISTKPKKRYDERQSQKQHFKNRFLERVGYILTEEKYEQLKLATIRTGQFLHRAEKGSAFRVEFENYSFIVIYNPFKDVLITILS